MTSENFHLGEEKEVLVGAVGIELTSELECRALFVKGSRGTSFLDRPSVRNGPSALMHPSEA